MIACHECGSPMQEEPVNIAGRTNRLPFVRLRCIVCGWLWWLASAPGGLHETTAAEA